MVFLSGTSGLAVSVGGVLAYGAVQGGAGYFGQVGPRLAYNAVVHPAQAVATRAHMDGVQRHQQAQVYIWSMSHNATI